MRFLLDLDGVVVDFVAGVMALFGRDPAELTEPGVGLTDAMGLRSGVIWRRIDGLEPPFGGTFRQHRLPMISLVSLWSAEKS